MKLSINWNNINTILLDMDGTLLDLHFDNYFWQEYVPLKYAEKYQLTLDQANNVLNEKYKKMEGTINWYCIDYWTQELGLEIEVLKHEVNHLIAIHPHVVDFLNLLKTKPVEVVLVTNAHQKSLDLKMKQTQLSDRFDKIVCAHDLGLPKEAPDFWSKLKTRVDYQFGSTMLVDDSLSVLRSAKQAGIAHLVTIIQPDSKRPQRDIGEFPAIMDFRELMEN